RVVETCGRGGTAVSGEADLAGAGHSGDDAIRTQLPHPVVEPIYDEEVAVRVHAQAVRTVQAGLDGWAAVPRVPCIARSSHRGDHPGRAHLAYPVTAVPEVEVTGCVDDDSRGPVDQCLDGWPPVPGDARLAGS